MEQNPFNDVKETRPAPATKAPSKPPEKPAPIEAPAKPAPSRRWLAVLITVVLAFGLGFVPMWLKAGRHGSERDAARHEVKRLQLEGLVAAAAVDARRGEYEPARQAASQFFTALGAELDLAQNSSLSVAQQGALKPLLTQRDGLITLLARSDPASAERLTEVYLACRKALRGG